MVVQTLPLDGLDDETETAAPVEFFVPGEPWPQGSKSAYVDKRTGRAVIVDGSSTAGKRKHRHWRRAVTHEARVWRVENPQPPFDEPLSIRLLFLVELPESDAYRTRHATKPDLDKLIRSVFDSLVDAELVVDDSRFFSVQAEAFYARPHEATGCRIRIERHGDAERSDREDLKATARRLRMR